MAFIKTTFQLFTQHLGNSDAGTYIGTTGEIFYDPNVGILKLSDGQTPGGISITSGGSAGAFDPTAYYTRAAVDGKFAALLGTADAQGDTLGELQTNIDGKLSLAGGTLTGPAYYMSMPVGVNELTNKNYVDTKISASITASLAALNTDVVTEGALNKYFTAAAFDSSFATSITSATKTPGIVRTVNGSAPNAIGNVSISLTATETGVLADRPAVAADGTLYVITGDPDPANDGRSFLWNSSTAAWVELAPSDMAANDARYVNIATDTMAGPLLLAADPLAPLEAATKQYVDNLTHTLNDLTDVVTTGATAGQALVYNGTGWVAATPPAAVSNLADLLDVSDVAPTAGQVLAWDVAASEWKPTSATAAAAGVIDSLLDVDTTTVEPVVGSKLVFDGANWVPTLPTDVLLAEGHTFGRVFAYGKKIIVMGSWVAENSAVSANQSKSRFLPIEDGASKWDKLWCLDKNIFALGDGKLYGYGANGRFQLVQASTGAVNNSLKPITHTSIFGPGITVLNFWSATVSNNLADGAFPMYAHVNDNGVLKTYGWSWNLSGMLGIASTTENITVPTIIPQLTGKSIKQIYNAGQISVVTTADGEVWTAGYDQHGTSGSGTKLNARTSFIQAKLNATTFVTGAKEAVINFANGAGVVGHILLNDGTVLGSGYNGYNNLAIGNTTEQVYFSPAKTSASATLQGVTKIYPHYGGFVALCSNGDVYSAGQNWDAHQGDGTARNAVNVYAKKINSNVDYIYVAPNPRGYTTLWQRDATTKKLYFSGDCSDYHAGGINKAATNPQPNREYVPFPDYDGEYAVEIIGLGGVSSGNDAYLGTMFKTNKGNVYHTGGYTGGEITSASVYIAIPEIINDYFDEPTTIGVSVSGGGSGTVVGTLDDLTDVTVTAPTTGQVLAYNGAQWVPSSVASPTLAAEFGEVIRSTLYSLSTGTASTTIQDFTLPSAGVWEVSYILDAYTAGASQTDQFVFQIEDASNNILNGSINDMFITDAANIRTTITQTVRITTTGATTYSLKARRVAGILTIDANRAKVIWKKISGLLPMTGTSQYHSSALSTVLVGGGNVAQDMTSVSNVTGNIPFTAGVWTLNAGVTYELFSSLTYDAAGNGSQIADTAVAFVDATTNISLPNQTGSLIITSIFQSRGIARNGVNRFIYTPTTNQTIKLRVTYQNGPGNLSAQTYISQIGSFTVNNTGATALSALSDTAITAPAIGSKLQWNGTKWVAAKDNAAVTGSAPLYYEAGLGDTQEALTGLGFTLSDEAAKQQNIAGNFNSAGIRLINTVGAGGKGSVTWNPNIDWTKNVRISFRMFIPNALTVDDIIVGMAGNSDASQAIEMSIDPYTGSYKVRKNNVNITTVPWANSPAGDPTGQWSRFVAEIITVNGKRILKLMRWVGGEPQIAASGDVTGVGTEFGGLYFYAWNGSAIPSNNVLLQSCQVEYI